MWVTPRTWTTAEVVTAAMLNTNLRDNLNHINQRVIGYAQVTANQNGIGTSYTALTGLSLAVSVVSGRRYKVTGHVTIQKDATAGVASVAIMEDLVTDEFKNRILRHDFVANGVLIGEGGYPFVAAATATRTFFLAARTTAGNLNSLASVDNSTTESFGPAWIEVEDKGV